MIAWTFLACFKMFLVPVKTQLTLFLPDGALPKLRRSFLERERKKDKKCGKLGTYFMMSKFL